MLKREGRTGGGGVLLPKYNNLSQCLGESNTKNYNYMTVQCVNKSMFMNINQVNPSLIFGINQTGWPH